jgi:hypothetical protein
VSSGFIGNVTLNCTGAPPAGNCTVAPGAVVLSGTTIAAVTVGVATTPCTCARIGPDDGEWLRAPPSGTGTLPGWVLWALVLMALAELATRRRRARVSLTLAVALLCLVASTSCRTVDTGTPPGTYTLPVTASSAGVTRTITLTLTVR